MNAVTAEATFDRTLDAAPAGDVRPRRHRWTTAEYFRLGREGVLPADAGVELIDGEIIDMAPIGSKHGGTINFFNHRFSAAVGNKALVSVQNPIVLDEHSAPQPDIVLLRWRDDYYRGAHPRPADVLLVIEVCDTTLRYDRDVKVPLYARYGIPEVWLLELEQRRLERYRQPEQGEYRRIESHADGAVTPVHLPEIAVSLADLFPTR